MKSGEELGDWRRTHYSTQITPDQDGKEVTAFGWVSSVRTHGGITFLFVNDKEGMFQVTTIKGKASDGIVEKMKTVGEQTSIGVRGTVKKIAKAPNGAEVIPSEIRILNPARKKPSFSVFGGALPSIDKRLDIRAVDLRRDRAQAVFKIQRVLLQSLRDFFRENGYLEVRTPKSDLDGDGGRGVPVLGPVLQQTFLPDPESSALQGRAGHPVREGLRNRPRVPGRGVKDPETPQRDYLHRHRGGVRGLHRCHGHTRGAGAPGRSRRRGGVRKGVREARGNTPSRSQSDSSGSPTTR